MRIIKKYKNRIMYDTETSKPITLRQLAEMIRENISFKIMENTSGKDITRATIFQILLDLEKSDKGVRHLIPDIISWLVETSKQEYRKAFHDILHGTLSMDFGHQWASHLVKKGIDAEILTSDNEARMVEQIASGLTEFCDEFVRSLEQTLTERIDAFGKLLSPTPDAMEGPKR